ncbi:hypothetical protein ASG52_22530 [Methylobacterium sp. Leaf456]|nr:hypothetical protein ASG52_22530 [Methylobacterium sp. Leaf456]
MPGTFTIRSTGKDTRRLEQRARLGRGLVFFLALLCALVGPLAGGREARAFDVELRSPFAPCRADCTATLFAGQLVETSMWEIFLTKHQGPWDWRWGSSTFVGGAFSREVVRFDRFAAIETEVGVGKRFGSLHEGEGWGALYFRWKWFPWDAYLRTTLGISIGLNYATGVPVFEARRAGVEGQNLLHYLSPELTFGLPSRPDLDLIFRFHHRSGGDLPFFNRAGGGAQYGTVGLRYRW